MRKHNQIAKTLMSFGLGATLAFGQAAATQAPATPKGHTGNHSADHGMKSSQGGGLMVGKSDEAFMMKAAQGGMAEVEAARLGQEKGTSNEVKEFARKLEQDHTKANEQLKKLAEEKNVTLPTDAGDHRAALDKVKAKSGEEFDKAWLKMMADHHKKDVNQFQKESTRAMDSDVRTFASSTLPTLQEHLKTVEELRSSTRGRKATSDAAKATSDAATSTSDAVKSTSGAATDAVKK